MIGHWFCSRHPHSMLQQRKGKGKAAIAICPVCHGSKLHRILPELRAAQTPKTYRTAYLVERWFGRPIAVKRWLPL